jgi:hypothetical protein
LSVFHRQRYEKELTARGGDVHRGVVVRSSLLFLTPQNIKGGKMLFLSIFTFGAENREAVLQRRATGGEEIPDGVQVLMEVVDLTENRVFRISEVTDPKAILAANMAWSDLAKIETVPVMQTDEVLETLDRMKERKHNHNGLNRPLEFYSQPQL